MQSTIPVALWAWLALGALLVGVELMTGSFYLLVLGLAALIAGLAAWMGASVTMQIVIVSIAGLAGSYAVHQWHKSVQRKNGPAPATQADPNINPDIGQVVQVSAWDAAGRARVPYRGALWDAVALNTASGAPQAGTYRIAQVQGAVLMLEPVA